MTLVRISLFSTIKPSSSYNPFSPPFSFHFGSPGYKAMGVAVAVAVVAATVVVAPVVVVAVMWRSAASFLPFVRDLL